MPEIREAQAQLAREAGIEGFMYWHYWFGNGKTLLANIFKEVLESGKPDFPFCLGWANHSWYSKTWNGSETSTKKLLIEQTYPGEKDARMYFESLLPAFKDHRYIKVDGKPLFYIFAPQFIPDEYITLFKRWTIEAGFPGIYLVANLSKDFENKDIYIKRGFDAITHPRLGGGVDKNGKVSGNLVIRGYKRLSKMIKSWIHHRPPFMTDYRIASQAFCTNMEKEEEVIPTIIPQWDHTPRSGWNGLLFVNSSPSLFKVVAKKAIQTVSHKSPQHQIIFLKSWNEWGEGNYMEPDLTNGRGYIDALRQAIEESRHE